MTDVKLKSTAPPHGREHRESSLASPTGWLTVANDNG